jgi:hypothetical protein
MCDKVRHDDTGEAFWQDMMKNKKKISEREFLKHVNPKNILDPDETWQQFKADKADDPDFAFYSSIDNVYFIQYAGFEYIWKEV